MTGGSLRSQVLMWVSLPLSVLWLASAWVDYDIAKRFVTVAYDRALLESALDIGRQVRVLRGRVYVDLPEVAIQMLRTRESGSLYYRVTGPGGEFVTGEPDIQPAAARPTGQAAYYDSRYRDQPVRVAIINLPVETEDIRGEVTVQVAEALSARNELLREVLLRMALPQFLLALLALSLIWFAVGRGLAPLRSLRREIEQRSHRDLSALPATGMPTEIRPIVESTNALLQRLAAALAAQQRFIADAAHQLRTPIAGLYTQTQLARRQTAPADIAASLEQLQGAAERTTHLINQLLALARAEPAAASSQRVERCDLAALARDTTTDWVPRALERNIDLGFDSELAASGAPIMSGDPLLLREMLNNLIDNAVRYTQGGGRITTRVKHDGARLRLTVEDNGPGIPEAEREAVLERFHRVLGSGVDGCGLGLAIVREIVTRHGGEIRMLAGADGKGTVAQVTFPLAA